MLWMRRTRTFLEVRLEELKLFYGQFLNDVSYLSSRVKKDESKKAISEYKIDHVI